MEKQIISKSFISEVKRIINNAQSNAVRSIDRERVLMYWNIGKQIVEEEQNGQDRAQYGAFVIKRLTEELLIEYGRGFSQRQLETCRQFYFTFPIAHTLRAELNWTQYKLLIRISDGDKQTYYIEEACKNNWSARQLERQINSQLYERLLLSTDKSKKTIFWPSPSTLVRITSFSCACVCNAIKSIANAGNNAFIKLNVFIMFILKFNHYTNCRQNSA